MPSVEQTLAAYAPVLRYHSDELYGAVAVEALADFFFDGGPGAPRGTVLRRKGRDAPLAATSPDADVRLSAQLLADSYGAGGPKAGKDDFLDAHNLAYAADAAIAQLDDAYRDVAYATFAPRADRKPGGWAQYWFFYYFNSKAALASLFGPQEGDWEMVQVRVDGDGKADAVTYAQHGYFRRADWDSDLVQKIDGRPVVYVALGSHASYFEAGRHPVKLPVLGSSLIDDICDEGGREVEPRVVVLDHASPPSWARWPGRWGASIEGKFRSPDGPARKSVWAKPDKAHAEADDAEPLEGLEGLEAEATFEPDVQAWREGDRVHVTYRVPSRDDRSWLAELVLAFYETPDTPPRQDVFDVSAADTGEEESVGPSEPRAAPGVRLTD